MGVVTDVCDSPARRWLPDARRGLIAGVGLLLACSVILWLSKETDWHPRDVSAYYVVVLACWLSILITPRFPRLGLAAAVVLSCWPWWSFNQIEFRQIPLVLTAWLATVSGCTLRVALPLLAVGILVPAIPFFPGRVFWHDPFTDSGVFDPSLRVLVSAVVLAAALLGASMARQRATLVQLHQRHAELERLRERDSERIAAQERTAIAREVHDVVAHHVAAMVVRAQAAARVADRRPEELRATVVGIAESGQQALQSMRQVVRVLRGTAEGGALDVRLGLASEIEDAVARVRLAGLDVEVVGTVPASLDELQEAAMQRICQESLTNALIHAGPTKVEIAIHESEHAVSLTITDDGPVAPMLARPGGLGGSGIPGMRERADAVGGHLVAGSFEQGWRVSFTLHRDGRREARS
jgi:signal transduction histidine kinase